ncbi:ribonuclease H-like domain-containing protein [Tanacetum coccineum]
MRSFCTLFQVLANDVTKGLVLTENTKGHVIIAKWVLFSSKDEMDAMIENGPWFIRNTLHILKKWTPYSNLLKEDVGNVPVWSYARAMFELRADVELKDTNRGDFVKKGSGAEINQSSLSRREYGNRDDDILYKFKEGDFHRLHIQDIEDMLLLLIQGKLTNLNVEEQDSSMRTKTEEQIDAHSDELQQFSDGVNNPAGRGNTKVLSDIKDCHGPSDEHAEYDESNTYVLERFNTTARNHVKKILLKLNLSDHRRPYALSWKPCQGDSLNLPDHRIHKDGDGDASFQLESDSLPHAHAQTTKTYYKHQDSRIMKAQELKTKTSAQTLIYKIFLQRY